MRPKGPRPARLALAVLLAGAAACTGDLPLQPTATPGGPLHLVNPACAGTAGLVHLTDTVTAHETWGTADNPHRVAGTVYVEAGGRIRMQPGVVVCFYAPGSTLFSVPGIEANNGGYVQVDGADNSIVLLTAAHPAEGWGGVMLRGTPSGTSFMKHARLEHVDVSSAAVTSQDAHLVVLDSIHLRQVGRAVHLASHNSRILRSRVDTTTDRYQPAVVLGDSTRFTQTVVRRAAGTGVQVTAEHGVQLLGGRIEGSGGTGLVVNYPGALYLADPVRITGGSSYGVEMPADALARTYGTLAELDSLLGNARDTIVVTGGTLHSAAYVRAGLPWHVRSLVRIGTGGSLRPEPGARLAFDQYAYIEADSGRVLARGTQAAPVVFTADDPALGWWGIQLKGTPSSTSFLTNVLIEETQVWASGVSAWEDHAVVIDSAVLRHNGMAAALLSHGSRLSRTRIDTTLHSGRFAVSAGANLRIESTLIRGAAYEGIHIWSPDVQVVSCEVRESGGMGSVVEGFTSPMVIRNCNLVDNGWYGLYSSGLVPTDAEGNWWGDAAGPTGPNGDGVSSWVDYTPWLTSPYVLPYVP